MYLFILFYFFEKCLAYLKKKLIEFPFLVEVTKASGDKSLGIGIHLFVKVPRSGDSEMTFSVFESSCHLLLPV